jgi:hypothetical protein
LTPEVCGFTARLDDLKFCPSTAEFINNDKTIKQTNFATLFISSLTPLLQAVAEPF